MLGALAGGLSALTGCTSVATTADGKPVSLLCAGSLQKALLDSFGEGVQVEAHGSAAAARFVADGVRDPDVVALADPVLFERILDAPWHARFATNELVVAYDADTEAGRHLEAADRWFEPFVAGDLALGRTDPDLDPLGYRTLFALELAADHYDRPDLPDSVLADSTIYPETSLLARLDTGALDAAMTYRNMAVDRGFATLALPPAINLGVPARREQYTTVSYTLSDGTTVTGDLIEYAATVRHRTDAAVAIFETLVGGAPLADHGFGLPARYPAFEGNVPDSIVG